jgi:hypothetical protein
MDSRDARDECNAGWILRLSRASRESMFKTEFVFYMDRQDEQDKTKTFGVRLADWFAFILYILCIHVQNLNSPSTWMHRMHRIRTNVRAVMRR